jgi:integrase
MSIQRLPSGRLRGQVYDPRTGKNVSVVKVLGLPKGTTWPDTREGRREAKAARERAREKLYADERPTTVLTLGEWWTETWTQDPLFARPKQSTNVNMEERTRAFVKRYGSVPLAEFVGDRGDKIVAEWLAGGKNVGTVKWLRAMFSDAGSAKAGRLVSGNPFAGLGIGNATGNRDKTPPTVEEMEAMLHAARKLTPPSFAAYLEFACMSGFRPGELDALRPEAIDWEADEVHITEQWNAKVRTFTEPKYGAYTGALTAPARAVLIRMGPEAQGRYVFQTLRGHHYTPSSRTHHWNRVRIRAGLEETSFYLATRHYFGWYSLNVLELEPSVIAHQLGHRDGGKLVEQLYGHREQARSREKVRRAFQDAGKVRHLRAVRETGA